MDAELPRGAVAGEDSANRRALAASFVDGPGIARPAAVVEVNG